MSPNTTACIEEFLLSSPISASGLSDISSPSQEDEGDSMATQPGSREQVNIVFFFFCCISTIFVITNMFFVLECGSRKNQL